MQVAQLMLSFQRRAEYHTAVVDGPCMLCEVDSITVCLLFKPHMQNRIAVAHTSQKETQGS